MSEDNLLYYLRCLPLQQIFYGAPGTGKSFTINQECQGRVTYLPAAWNVTHNIFGRADKLYPQAPAAVYDALYTYFLDKRQGEVIKRKDFVR